MNAQPQAPRLTNAETAILDLLLEGRATGAELLAAAAGRIKKGTLYETLRRMRAKGLLTRGEHATWLPTTRGRETYRALMAAARRVARIRAQEGGE